MKHETHKTRLFFELQTEPSFRLSGCLVSTFLEQVAKARLEYLWSLQMGVIPIRVIWSRCRDHAPSNRAFERAGNLSCMLRSKKAGILRETLLGRSLTCLQGSCVVLALTLLVCLACRSHPQRLLNANDCSLAGSEKGSGPL